MGFDDAREAAVSLEVRKAQFSLLAQSAVRAVPINVLNGVLISAIAYGQCHVPLHITWCTVLLCASIVRFGVMRRAQKADRLASPLEMKAYYVLTAISGAAWGATPYLLTPNVSALTMTGVCTAVAGMAAGAAVVVADRRSVVAYVVPCLGIVVSFFLIQGGWQSVPVSMMMLIFILVVCKASSSNVGTLVDALDSTIRLRELKLESDAQSAAMTRLAEYNDSAAKRAEQKVKSSAAVFSNVSYALRTPLTSVVGMAQLLESSAQTDEQREMSKQICKAGDELERLISDVMEVSRIETGRLDINLQDVTCKQINEKLQFQFADIVGTKGLEFNTACLGDCDSAIRGDLDRVLQVASIFVENSIRFTQAGQIDIISSVAVDDKSDQATLRVEVRDTGEGVPANLRDKLFDAFLSDTMDPVMREAGTGLGLHLAKRLAHFMNGNVGYEPNGQTGSVFWIEIVAKVSARADKYANGEQLTVDRRKRRIVVAEEDLPRQSVLLGNLKALDCVVTCVTSFSQLEEELNTGAFDAIVVGLELEDRNVDTVAGDVLALMSTAAMTPIVRMSADLASELVDTETEVLISAPIKQDVLLQGLDVATRERRNTQTGMRDAS